mmetsp:Transcript_4442/g.12813  ORF Transcript_4442/g.12813 Transcript_4442/m.12813 type:complete len:261 (+) Transcript_4442:197-979(+)
MEGFGCKPSPRRHLQERGAGVVGLMFPSAVPQEFRHLFLPRPGDSDEQRGLRLVLALRVQALHGTPLADVGASPQQVAKHLQVTLGHGPEECRVRLFREEVSDPALIRVSEQGERDLGLPADARPIHAISLRTVAQVEVDLQRSAASDEAFQLVRGTHLDRSAQLAPQPRLGRRQRMLGHRRVDWGAMRNDAAAGGGQRGARRTAQRRPAPTREPIGFPGGSAATAAAAGGLVRDRVGRPVLQEVRPAGASGRRACEVQS